MDNIHIILVEPQYKGNVGSVARVMRNFGFNNLRIVGKIPDKDDFVMAVHADVLLDKTRVYDTLAEATADLDRLVAVSRRRGKKVKVPDYTPKTLAAWLNDLGPLPVGLIFGRETFGLTDEEADLCPLRLQIQVHPDFPSLNLAQAVAVVCYELYSSLKANHAFNEAADDNAYTVNYVMQVFNRLKYFTRHDQEKTRFFWSRLLARANTAKLDNYHLRQQFNRILVLATGQGLNFAKKSAKHRASHTNIMAEEQQPEPTSPADQPPDNHPEA